MSKQRPFTRRPFSNASPGESILESHQQGIYKPLQAIAQYPDADKTISLQVFGDEITGEKMHQVVKTVDRMKKVDPKGRFGKRISDSA